jgi:hypothetical protein
MRKTAVVAVAGLALAGSAARGAETVWEKTKDSLTLKQHGQVVWRFVFGAEATKPYFHPLALPGGPTLTELKPADHPWHYGCWFSWKYLNGVNYWEEDPRTGKPKGLTEWDEPTVQTGADGAAHMEMTLRYRVPDAEPLLKEQRTLRLSPPGEDDSYTLDWTSSFTALQDVTLDRTPLPGEPDGVWYGGYAGLSFRMANALQTPRVLPSEGDVTWTQETYRTRAVAMEYSGTVDGQEVGVAILAHSANLNAPSPWYAIQSNPMKFFSPAVLQAGPHALKAGESFTLRYRLVIHPGRWSAERLKLAAAAFERATEP